MIDYRKIIKSRKLRLAILRFLSFIPDKTMLKLQYRIQLGRKLDLKKPQRYTEKLQLYKLCYKNPLMIQCVDKFDVRQYVSDKGLSKYLNECYGVFERAEEVDFDLLPDKFVLKDTLGGGGVDVIIVKDKKMMNKNEVFDTMNRWINTPVKKGGGREWPYYSGKKHRIIAEKYIECDDVSGLSDYKFNCFNGTLANIMVYSNRTAEMSHTDTYDENFNIMKVNRIDAGSLNFDKYYPIEKPANFDIMKEIVSILSKDFPHVRVDLYNVKGNIIFGELTFFPNSGYEKYKPDSFDFEMGKLFKLERKE